MKYSKYKDDSTSYCDVKNRARQPKDNLTLKSKYSIWTSHAEEIFWLLQNFTLKTPSIWAKAIVTGVCGPIQTVQPPQFPLSYSSLLSTASISFPNKVETLFVVKSYGNGSSASSPSAYMFIPDSLKPVMLLSPRHHHPETSARCQDSDIVFLSLATQLGNIVLCLSGLYHVSVSL